MIRNLLSNIQQRFTEITDIESCYVYPLPQSDITAPMVCLEIANFSTGDDPATSELALTINMEARVVVDSVIEDAEIICQTVACNVANAIHLNSFGCAVSPGNVTGISRDTFKPEFDAYICWLVEWSHQLHLGQSVWLESGVTPHLLHINEEPIYG